MNSSRISPTNLARPDPALLVRGALELEADGFRAGAARPGLSEVKWYPKRDCRLQKCLEVYEIVLVREMGRLAGSRLALVADWNRTDMKPLPSMLGGPSQGKATMPRHRASMGMEAMLSRYHLLPRVLGEPRPRGGDPCCMGMMVLGCLLDRGEKLITAGGASPADFHGKSA